MGQCSCMVCRDSKERSSTYLVQSIFSLGQSYLLSAISFSAKLTRALVVEIVILALRGRRSGDPRLPPRRAAARRAHRAQGPCRLRGGVTTRGSPVEVLTVV